MPRDFGKDKPITPMPDLRNDMRKKNDFAEKSIGNNRGKTPIKPVLTDERGFLTCKDGRKQLLNKYRFLLARVAANNPLPHPPGENDQTVLNFYRAQYYDPILKRFISEDPAGLTAGLNGYRYVNHAITESHRPASARCGL